jgi:hypothetical protein
MKKTVLLLFILLVLSISVSCTEDKAGGDEQSFLATIIEISGNTVTVEPLEGEDILRSSDRVTFATDNLDEIGVSVGDVVNILYKGEIMESYPAQVNAVSWTNEFY